MEISLPFGPVLFETLMRSAFKKQSSFIKDRLWKNEMSFFLIPHCYIVQDGYFLYVLGEVF